MIREFAAMLCVSAVGCCTLKMLLPENGLEPVLRIILSAFFLLCLFLPLRDLDFEFPDSAVLQSAAEVGPGELEQTYREQLARSAAENVRKVIEVRLQRMGIDPEEVKLEVKVHIDGDGRIGIEGIEVFPSEGHAERLPEIEAMITREMELPCRIVGEG